MRIRASGRTDGSEGVIAKSRTTRRRKQTRTTTLEAERAAAQDTEAAPGRLVCGPGVASLTLTVPVGPSLRSYNPRHLEIVLSESLADGLGRLFNGLRATLATLENGRPVGNHRDAVWWMLEQLESRIESEHTS